MYICPIFFISHVAYPFLSPFFFFFAEVSNNERLDELLHVLGDDGKASKGESGVDEGRAGGAEDLEGGLGK